jgi:hypothetical protein
MGRRLPNIVVFVLDCVRQRSIRWNGAPGEASTPCLDRLASEALVFDRAVAPANWTLPSHASLLSGLYPSEHGIRTVRDRSQAHTPLLAAELRSEGYATAMFTEQAHLCSDSGLAAGYELCRNSTPAAPPHHGPFSGLPDPGSAAGRITNGLTQFFVGRRAALALPGAYLVHRDRLRAKLNLSDPALIRAACRWILERPPDRPFHLLLNAVDAHEPYPMTDPRLPGLHPSELLGLLPASLLLQTPEAGRRAALERLREAYCLAIERADAKLGMVMSAIEHAGLQSETAIIVTSDHGQQFGESGNVFHSGGVSDAVTRVPLLLRLPDSFALRGRSDAWTSLCSIRDWCGALSRGESPFQASSEGDDAPNRRPEDAGAVFCEGSAAHEVNSVFARRQMNEPWNHRLLARFGPGGKAVFDIDQGSLRRWPVDADNDASEPELLTGEAARHLAGKLFPPAMRTSPMNAPFLSLGSRSPTPLEEHLAAWGYS